MNYKKILFVIGLIVSMEPLRASSVFQLVKGVLSASKGQYTKTKDIVSLAAKKFQDKFKVNDIQNITSCDKGMSSGSMQAARADAHQEAAASGFLNYSKNSTATTNNVTHNHHYGPQGWGKSFFEWMQNGGQSRSAATGLVVGGVSGYGIHAATAKPVERIIVVHAPSQGESSTLRAVVGEIERA
jgi:hypothetical protein